MKNGSLWLLALIAIFAVLAATVDIPVHDNATVPVNTQPITVSGQLSKSNLQGIPGTTPPSSYSVAHGGTVYYLYFPDASVKDGFATGSNVEVHGVLSYTKSETPDGTVNRWPVIEVRSIKKLP